MPGIATPVTAVMRATQTAAAQTADTPDAINANSTNPQLNTQAAGATAVEKSEPTGLLHTPDEVLELIIMANDAEDRPILGLADLSSLALVNRRLSAVADATLYNRNKNEHSGDALLWAARSGSIDTLKKALAFGLDIRCGKPNKFPTMYPTPLCEAAKTGHIAIISWLLDNGAEIERSVPLFCALSAGQEAAAIVLLSRGASLNYSGREGQDIYPPDSWYQALVNGALTHAIIFNCKHVLAYMVSQLGVDLNTERNSGHGQLVAKVVKCSTDKRTRCKMFQTLLSLGANPNGPGPTWQQSHLRAALTGRHFDLARLLLKAGARVDNDYIPLRAGEPWYPTPLQDFLKANRTGEVDCDWYTVRQHGYKWVYRSPGPQFIDKSHPLLRQLIDMGADVNHIKGNRSDFRSPLITAINYSWNADVELLLKAGAFITYDTLRRMMNLSAGQIYLHPVANIHFRGFHVLLDDDGHEDVLRKIETLVTHLVKLDGRITGSEMTQMRYGLRLLLKRIVEEGGPLPWEFLGYGLHGFTVDHVLEVLQTGICTDEWHGYTCGSDRIRSGVCEEIHRFLKRTEMRRTVFLKILENIITQRVAKEGGYVW